LLKSRPLRRLPFRWKTVSTPGKSRALNAAIQLSRGTVLLWTDDDVRVRADWVTKMSQPILDRQFDALAGAVSIPEVLLSRIRGTSAERRMWMFASTDGIDFGSPQFMLGANMAFGRHVLARVPGFDEELGPGALGYAEDTNFSRRLISAGFSIGGVPDCPVDHHFDVSRLDPATSDAMSARLGASLAHVAFRWERRRVRFPRLKLLKAMASHPVKALSLRLRGTEQDRLEDLRHDHVLWCAYLRRFIAMQRAASAVPAGDSAK
jgi:GT2 family glycosyltransferase